MVFDNIFQAFVATASCNIEVFKIGKDSHEKIAKFPTVALVKQLVYDETGIFSQSSLIFQLQK